MSAAERDFSNFQLGDNVYELAGGLIPEVAERLDVKLGVEPNSDDLWNLVGRIGSNKVLRDNEEIVAIDRGGAVELVELSGVQKPLNRSLWTPDISGDLADTFVLAGAVANWQDRAADAVINRSPQSLARAVRYAAGSRVMDTATEQANPNVQLMFERDGQYPTEGRYAVSTHFSRISGEADLPVHMSTHSTQNGDEIAAELFESSPHLLDQRLAFVRVANAGIQLAVQMRRAARAIRKDFDADPENPQVFIVTDTFPLARTEAEDSRPREFQKASTALRQVALTAKLLHEAAAA